MLLGHVFMCVHPNSSMFILSLSDVFGKELCHVIFCPLRSYWHLQGQEGDISPRRRVQMSDPAPVDTWAADGDTCWILDFFWK